METFSPNQYCSTLLNLGYMQWHSSWGGGNSSSGVGVNCSLRGGGGVNTQGECPSQILRGYFPLYPLNMHLV